MLSRIVATAGIAVVADGLDVVHGCRPDAVASNGVDDSLGTGRFSRNVRRWMRRFAKPSQSPPMRPSTITPNTSRSEDVSAATRQRWHLRDYIRRKFEGRRIDVVVANTTPALQFVIRYREELFPGVPIVVRRRPHAGARSHSTKLPGITGVLSDAAFGETLELALRLHPSVKRVFVVAQAPTVEGYDERVRAALGTVFGAGRAHLYQGEVAAWPPCRRHGRSPRQPDSLHPLLARRRRSGRVC